MLNKGTFMKLELDGSIEHNLQSPKSANYFMLQVIFVSSVIIRVSKLHHRI